MLGDPKPKHAPIGWVDTGWQLFLGWAGAVVWSEVPRLGYQHACTPNQPSSCHCLTRQAPRVRPSALLSWCNMCEGLTPLHAYLSHPSTHSALRGVHAHIEGDSKPARQCMLMPLHSGTPQSVGDMPPQFQKQVCKVSHTYATVNGVELGGFQGNLTEHQNS